MYDVLAWVTLFSFVSLTIAWVKMLWYHWVKFSAGGLLFPEDITRLVVSFTALTWFIRYIYYWNLQFLANVTYQISSLRHIRYSPILDILFRPFGFLPPNTFKLFGVTILQFLAYLMKVIPKRRRAYYIWYLRDKNLWGIQSKDNKVQCIC